MSIIPPRTVGEKRCFVYCGDDRCDCGAAELAAAIEAGRHDIEAILAEDRERRRAARRARNSKVLIR